MISRRRLLAMSVTGCATCGGLGISALAQSAGADSSTAIKGAGYDMWFIGAQRETIMNGKLAAALDLKTLAGRQHLYGIGPVEQLRGEVTIANSRPALDPRAHWRWQEAGNGCRCEIRPQAQTF